MKAKTCLVGIGQLSTWDKLYDETIGLECKNVTTKKVSNADLIIEDKQRVFIMQF